MSIDLNPLFAPTIPDGGIGTRLAPLFDTSPRDWGYGIKLTPLFDTERVKKSALIGIILDPMFSPGDSVANPSYPIATAPTGFTAFMDAILGRVQPGALTIKLFVNNIQVNGVSDTSAFTEMTGHGYVQKQLAPADWFVSVDNGVARAVHPPVKWTFTSGATIPIYGYYAVDTNGILRWAGRFIGLVANGGAGDTLTLEPSFSFEGK